MKRSVFLLSLLSALLSVPMISSAQIYELAERSNPWNQGRNINGLRKDSTTVSYAELYGGYEAGGLRQHHEANSSWNAGLIAESMLHLEKMSLKGLFNFENQQAYQACGSMFVRQDYYPVNAIEFTPGNKTRQKYAFDGGLTYDIAPEWRIGGKLAFTSMNWSKRKDLRHTTYLLDLSLTPSFLWHRGDFSFGMSYILSKNSETVKASQIGETAEDYMVFLDKGLRYGAYEHWEGNGVHLKEAGVDGLPVKEILNGAAIQFTWKDLYIDAEYLYGSGKIGEKDYIWFEFPSHHTKVFMEYQLYRPKARHHFRLGFSSRYMTNHENALEKKPEGGVSTVQKYASNRILTEERYTWMPEYELVAPKWRLRWNAEIYHNKTLASQIFPYLCSDILIGGHTSLEGFVHIWRFELGAGMGFGMASITEKDRIAAEPEGTVKPVRINSYDKMWVTFRELPKLDCNLSLRYNIWRGIYVEAAGTYLRGFPGEQKSSLVPQTFKDLNRWSVQLKVGLNF